MTIKYRPRCFLDVEVDSNPAGRLVLELFSDICPLTCDNFRALCTGEKGLGKTTQKALHYKGVVFHRIVKDFMIQGGDFSEGNGKGGESIYGGTFKDESLTGKHDKPFLLSMANRGKDTNGSQFFITTQPAPHLDGVHVVFGHVISGQDVVSRIENERTDQSSCPVAEIKIANCGELVPKIKAKSKKRKRDASEESTEEGESKSESEGSDEKKKKKRKKKKKKSKKHKKDKKKDENEKPAREEGELASDGEVICSVKAEDIPEIPVSNFLMRKLSPKENNEKVEDSQKRKSNYLKRQQVSRSGRKIKGRGFMRYRTPSRSRTRSRSYTPPHWRQAQARVVPLSEYQKRVQEIEKEAPAAMPSPSQQWEEQKAPIPERYFHEEKGESLHQVENGDHNSKKDVFDRENAAKENVSYPIGYSKNYASSNYNRPSYGEDWRTTQVVDNQTKSNLADKGNYAAASNDKLRIKNYKDELEPAKSAEVKSAHGVDKSSAGKQKISSPGNRQLSDSVNSEKAGSPTNKFDKSPLRSSRHSRRKSKSSSSSKRRESHDDSPLREGELKAEKSQKSSRSGDDQSAKSFSTRKLSPKRRSPSPRNRSKKSPWRGRSGSSPSPPRRVGRREFAERNNKKGKRSSSTSSSSEDEAGQRHRNSFGGNRSGSPRYADRRRPYNKKRDSNSRSQSPAKKLPQKPVENSPSPVKKTESVPVLPPKKLVQDYASPKNEEGAAAFQSFSPHQPAKSNSIVNAVEEEEEDEDKDEDKSTLFSSDKFTASTFVSVAEEQKGYSALETLHHQQQQQQYQQQIDYEREEQAARDELAGRPPPPPKKSPKVKKSEEIFPDIQLDDILLPGETRDEGGIVKKPEQFQTFSQESGGGSMWKAIPEATNTSIGMSTLERLQRQQLIGDVVEKSEIIEADKKVDVKPDGERSALRGSVSPKSRNRRSRSRSKTRRWRRSRSRSRSFHRGRGGGERGSRSGSRSRSRSRGRRAPYRNWRRPHNKYRPPYIPNRRRSSSAGRKKSPRRRRDRRSRSRSSSSKS